MAYESDVAGTLREILAHEGETLPIGSPIARIGESNGEGPSVRLRIEETGRDRSAGPARRRGRRTPSAEQQGVPPRRPTPRSIRV